MLSLIVVSAPITLLYIKVAIVTALNGRTANLCDPMLPEFELGVLCIEFHPIC
jgi:hypothetical protein